MVEFNLKTIKIKRENVQEVTSWLENNLSPENFRWWLTPISSVWNETKSEWTPNFIVNLDVTEEEESRLMYFILKYDN